ncbi:MAG: MerR family transcriptional regulator [Candidatus Omnitrophica bacterium]|nr:MerR family transcriptional regulator [Candidatus Omnitrophota bacterium]MBU4479578.1 MerR family transcriptional regulator [Candidatus Omnitrophota bacterium]MCG2703493.1 MerR family transcriptional regulator [Candidatus Omnitrophota bacterium]
MSTRQNGNGDGFGAVEVVRQVGISPEKLRYWEKRGIVKPRHVQRGKRKIRRYSQEDVHRAVLVKVLLDTEKYSLEGAIIRLEDEK